MDKAAVQNQIVNWLKDYCEKAKMTGFVVGISGGIDSALTSTLCAMTGKKVVCLNLPLRQNKREYERAIAHIKNLEQHFENVSSIEVNLTHLFDQFTQILPLEVAQHSLSMANSRARLRMTSLYAVGQANNLLVAGTGNKIEDFGIGFFTKYGDGGVDLSPIADLYKTEVFALAKHIGVIESILTAQPTDGLWEDNRNDEDQIGASYEELEWAMEHITQGIDEMNERQKKVMDIYHKLHNANKHKMEAIPICKVSRK